MALLMLFGVTFLLQSWFPKLFRLSVVAFVIQTPLWGELYTQLGFSVQSILVDQHFNRREM